ncbi:MAG: hypothetical protein WAL84_05460 [Candidatus Dormiibacterota bacterium]
MRRTVPPSAEIQAEIDRLLGKGMVDDPQKMLGDLARLGARLIIQRAVEEEFDGWLGRARYERRPERERGLKNYEAGLRTSVSVLRGPRRLPAVNYGAESRASADAWRSRVADS